jgi:hypothetical protein
MSITDYYFAASVRSFWAGWEWASGQGILLGILEGISTIIFAMVIVIIFHRRRPSARYRLLRAVRDIVGVVLVLLGILFFVFFIQDAPNQIRIRDEKIAQLGGSPDMPVSMPQLGGAEKDKVLAALSRLSDFLNGDGRKACNLATALQGSYGINFHERGKPEVYAANAKDIFALTRHIYGTLLGAHNDGGILQSGDPLLVAVMAQAVQQKDHDTIIQFDGYALSTYNLLSALSAVDVSGEREKLFDPVASVVTDPMNLWDRYTGKFCKLIDTTNGRIAEMRASLR